MNERTVVVVVVIIIVLTAGTALFSTWLATRSAIVTPEDAIPAPEAVEQESDTLSEEPSCEETYNQCIKRQPKTLCASEKALCASSENSEPTGQAFGEIPLTPEEAEEIKPPVQADQVSKELITPEL